MSYLKIGSGDVKYLLSGKKTKGYADLWRKFMSETQPYYNALASPIDACRTGAILETAYLQTLSDDYFVQVKQTCNEMTVFRSSIDFAKINAGIVVDFDELKTIFLTDYIDIIVPISQLDINLQQEAIKKKFKKEYNQVQFQLLCAGLDSANLCFLSVDTYEDSVNWEREIDGRDVKKFRISRDEEVIKTALKRGQIFQQVADHFKNETHKTKKT